MTTVFRLNHTHLKTSVSADWNVGIVENQDLVNILCMPNELKSILMIGWICCLINTTEPGETNTFLFINTQPSLT